MEQNIIKMNDGRSIKYKRLETIEFTSGKTFYLKINLYKNNKFQIVKE
jgi:hypothetical protein